MSNQLKGRPGGVLPINAAATRKPASSAKSAQRLPAPRLRLIIRRLPPGLTENEFWEALGNEWQIGGGQVDWFAYKPGKISKDLSKPSRPSRAYLKVKEQSTLDSLSYKVKQTQFKDAKNTNTDPCLIGPPSLEFAPYNKSSGGRVRNDGRQGTIDQDPEFIDFLQSLTEPIVKQTPNGSDSTEAKSEKVTMTPLVQFIKEKKANKAKEKEAAATAKSSKKSQEAKEAKSKGESRSTVVVKSNANATEKARVAKATQEAVKAISKSVASMQSKTASTKSELKAKEGPALVASTSTPASTPNTTVTPKRERERGNASAAARLISRDLGLTPKEPRTPRAARNTTTSASAVVETAKKPEMTPVTPAQTSAAPASKPTVSVTNNSTAPPTGPRSTRSANTSQQPKQSQSASQRQTKTSSQPTSGAKSAFLKHANPSQGITEELLRTIFAEFGEITRCEIDKKKGLGYVDFADSEALKKAMAASPVKVANGQVVVLENRSPYRKNAQSRGGEAATTSQTQLATQPTSSTTAVSQTTIPSTAPPPTVVATAEPSTGTNEAVTATPTETGADAIAQGQTATTQSTSRAGKGGTNNQRGGKGGPNSSSGRGGHNGRGGRGGHRGRGRGGRSAASQTTSAGAASSATSDPQGNTGT